MKYKQNKFQSKVEAMRQASNAYNLACDMHGKDNVKFDVDERNKRYVISRPDSFEGVIILYFYWG